MEGHKKPGSRQEQQSINRDLNWALKYEIMVQLGNYAKLQVCIVWTPNQTTPRLFQWFIASYMFGTLFQITINDMNPKNKYFVI